MMVLDRFPLLVWLGAMLLGWIAGDVIETDPAVHPLLERSLNGHLAVDVVGYVSSLLGSATVLVVGSVWRKRRLQHLEQLALHTAVDAAQSTDRP